MCMPLQQEHNTPGPAKEQMHTTCTTPKQNLSDILVSLVMLTTAHVLAGKPGSPAPTFIVIF